MALTRITKGVINSETDVQIAGESGSTEVDATALAIALG